MESEILYIFQLELNRQCKFALIAAHDLMQAHQHDDRDRLWYSMQALLVAAGNISKLLWPPKPHLPERATELRASLGVVKQSPLEPRTFRNHFEHFDERLEMWALSSERQNFIDSNVGPADALPGFEPEDCLRHFDPVNLVITFRGDTYHLQPVIDAVRDLSKKIVQSLNPF